MVTILAASTPTQFEDFRVLVREFVSWAVATSSPVKGDRPPVFAKLENELANLPGKYSEPDGSIFLAYVDEEIAGCIAGFRSDHRTLEVTRLWVLPTWRGHSVGDRLVQALLTHAQSTGYERAVLRSRADMTAAHKVYQRAGFFDMDGGAHFANFGDIEIAMERDIG
jgi:ribosomal protein S18 acetylase RimI-like enzyme